MRSPKRLVLRSGAGMHTERAAYDDGAEAQTVARAGSVEELAHNHTEEENDADPVASTPHPALPKLPQRRRQQPLAEAPPPGAKATGKAHTTNPESPAVMIRRRVAHTVPERMLSRINLPPRTSMMSHKPPRQATDASVSCRALAASALPTFHASAAAFPAY